MTDDQQFMEYIAREDADRANQHAYYERTLEQEGE